MSHSVTSSKVTLLFFRLIWHIPYTHTYILAAASHYLVSETDRCGTCFQGLAPQRSSALIGRSIGQKIWENVRRLVILQERSALWRAFRLWFRYSRWRTGGKKKEKKIPSCSDMVMKMCSKIKNRIFVILQAFKIHKQLKSALGTFKIV